MSFGGPGGGQKAQKPTPPERGSFPLDHDGECKPIMSDYLRCVRRMKGINDNECRLIAKEYLRCRMERNLMLPDDFKNLGLPGDDVPKMGLKQGGKLPEVERKESGKGVTR